MATRTKGVNAAHTAGIFADMTLDGPEIGTLVAVVDRAKNLPNRKTMGKQDPYCAMRLGKEARKTDTDKRGGQTPRWDQELRFTVYDSPDYYKLKCSIFNDDKKTDLIGESWFDLQDVIVPGGGQSDRWRQLNFKGKYAGDIRMELTYYDTRPKPEMASEGKRQRDKSFSVASEATTSVSSARQLGPREIKRRPLPPGPTSDSSPIPATPSAGLWHDQEQARPASNHGYTNSNPPPRPPKQIFIPETPDDVGYDINPQFGPGSYEPRYDDEQPYQQRYPSDDYQNHHIPAHALSAEPDFYGEDLYQRSSLQAQPSSLQPTRALSNPEQDFQALSHSSSNPSRQISYRSSPPARPMPQVAPLPVMQTQSWNGTTSTSPTKYTTYRDSPLRQSISHTDMPNVSSGYSDLDSRFDEDQPAPPPPAHRGQIARISPAPTRYEDPPEPISQEMSMSFSHRDTRGQPSPQTPVKHHSVESRSPLQRLECEYDPFQATTPVLQRQLPSPAAYSPSPTNEQISDHDRYPAFPTERRKSNTYETQSGVTSFRHAEPAEPVYSQFAAQPRFHERPRDEIRNSTGYIPPRRAQTYDSSVLHDERHVRRSDPLIVRPRAISPNPNHHIPRKSITPTPRTPDDSRDMGSDPYGPDSYDVLNPGTSPISNNGSFQSPQKTFETSIQKEVAKLQDEGPIIGNDGQVIDPSDHLPADTWAPEPERKQRRPEHVVRIRTREEARMHRNAASSPASVRPHSAGMSPYQPLPPAPLSSPYGSPATGSAPISPQFESANSRNRLRKPMAQRPLPTQPYPLHPESAPIVPTLPSMAGRPSPMSQQYPVHSSPAGTLPQRPPLSEYSVPAVSNYSPRGSTNPVANDYRQDHMYQTPTRSLLEGQQQREPMSYDRSSPYGAGNPLAMELSQIELGPSRFGRTTLRPQRAYGAY